MAVDQLVAPGRVVAQRDWLTELGIGELVEEGRAIWRAGAQVGDLTAIAGRSRVTEAEALTDPTGLGSFTVLEWRR